MSHAVGHMCIREKTFSARIGLTNVSNLFIVTATASLYGDIRCIRVLETENLGKLLVARTRTLSRGEEPLLSSGRTLIGSELSSPNFTHLSKWTIAVRYLNVVIKPLCDNLDIFLTTRLTPTFGRGILFAWFSRGPRPKVKDAFLDRAFRSRSCTI